MLSRPEYVEPLSFIDEQEPVTVSELKAQARVTHSAEDTLLQMYIASARRVCEMELQAKVRQQSVLLRFCKWGNGLILHGLGPHVSVTSVQYVDVNGLTQTLDSGSYFLQQGRTCKLWPLSVDWPSLSSQQPQITVTALAGYESASDVPDGIKHWIVAQAAAMYKNREAHADRPMVELQFIAGLLDPFRCPTV